MPGANGAKAAAICRKYGGLVPIGGIGTLPVQEHKLSKIACFRNTARARGGIRCAVLFWPWAAITNGTITIITTTLTAPPTDSGDRYPGYSGSAQDFRHLRRQLRASPCGFWQSVTLISRYEYQLFTIQHRSLIRISGLSSLQSSTMTSHILAQDVNWAPWSRLSLQLGVNYVRSETKTPASDVTQAILNARNNYWTLNLSSDLILDDKTDLIASYFYYRADDYQDNSTAGRQGLSWRGRRGKQRHRHPRAAADQASSRLPEIRIVS